MLGLGYLFKGEFVLFYTKLLLYEDNPVISYSRPKSQSALGQSTEGRRVDDALTGSNYQLTAWYVSDGSNYSQEKTTKNQD